MLKAVIFADAPLDTLPLRMEQLYQEAVATHPPEEAAQIAIKKLGSPAQFVPPPPKPVSRKACGVLAAVCCVLALLCGAQPVYAYFISRAEFASYLQQGSTPFYTFSVYGMQLCGMGLFLIAAGVFLFQALRKQK